MSVHGSFSLVDILHWNMPLEIYLASQGGVLTSSIPHHDNKYCYQRNCIIMRFRKGWSSDSHWSKDSIRMFESISDVFTMQSCIQWHKVSALLTMQRCLHMLTNLVINMLSKSSISSCDIIKTGVAYDKRSMCHYSIDKCVHDLWRVSGVSMRPEVWAKFGTRFGQKYGS